MEVVTLTPKEGYFGRILPDQILENARSKLKEVLVIGETPDGDFYIASSTSEAKEVLWLIESAKKMIL